MVQQQQQQQQQRRTSHKLTYIGTAAFPIFNLRRPPGFQVNHIPKGNLVLCSVLPDVFRLRENVACVVRSAPSSRSWLTIVTACRAFAIFLHGVIQYILHTGART